MEDKNNKFRFVEKALAEVQCPPSGKDDKSGRVWVYDDAEDGLAMCVTEGGSRTFYFYGRIMGRPQRVRIAKVGDIGIEAARRRIREIKGDVAKGLDPTAAKKAAREAAMKEVATIANLWQSYREGHLAQKKPTTIKAYDRIFDVYLAEMKSRPIASITPGDVEALKNRITKAHGAYMANRVLELLRAMYRSRGHLFGLPKRYSPTADVELNDERARDRILSPEELTRLLDAIKAEPNHTIRDYFLMALYTGARKSNVAAMKWQDVSLQRKEWRVPGAEMKNKNLLVVPLVPEAIEILERRADKTPPDSPYVFPARRLTPEQVQSIRELRKTGKTTREIASDLGLAQTSVMRAMGEGFGVEGPKPFNGTRWAWDRLLKAAKISERTTIHDLRRTFCTSLIEAGASLPYVAAAMGHRTMATTQRHYAIARQDGVRAAVNAGVAGMLAQAQTASAASAKTGAA